MKRRPGCLVPLRLVPLRLVPLCLALVAAPALAQEARPGGAFTLALAHDLYAQGLAAGDAVTVLAAARLASSVTVTLAEPAPLPSTAIPAPEAEQPTAAPEGVARARLAGTADARDVLAPASVSTMVAAARTLAAGDEMLLALVDIPLAAPSEARGGTARLWLSELPGGGAEVWRLPVLAGMTEELAVIGEGGGSLAIVVTDAAGGVICQPMAWPDRASCGWTPEVEGAVYLTIRNLGSTRASYGLATR